jgi:hypothetical protein
MYMTNFSIPMDNFQYPARIQGWMRIHHFSYSERVVSIEWHAFKAKIAREFVGGRDHSEKKNTGTLAANACLNGFRKSMRSTANT